ncbi:MAG: hypothetical protein A3I00_02750 [Betaproteobacteria bacterium RIFCSPLOWO2_02_FULL_64_12]|nr:MAG: hypothetical protein A3I00_02750 [Betaproteobacteria bacterium RIFCSPLOWO2_02_FULL_64_12]
MVKLDEVASGDPAAQPDNPQYAKRFLGEGDSWFSYNAVPHSANVLEQIHLPAPCVVLTLAQPGDTIRHMGAIASNPMLRRYLADRNFASNWNAILLSGGGNDLIDAVEGIIVAGSGTNPDGWINRTALADTLRTIENGYAEIVTARDAPGSASAGKPIVVHTYDYPTPNNTPATFLGVPAIGPWFWKRFEALGVADQRLRTAITDYVLSRLAETLLGLATRFANFRVIDTRGTLIRAAFGATGNSNDWLNEIHPNSAGYRKIADRICPVLSAIP